MAEVTQVPQQPIAKGSMLKFWLGLLLGIALGVGGAYLYSRPQTVSVDVITAGEGESPEEGDAVFIEYVGTLEDGTEFDRSPERDPAIPEEIAHLIPQGVYMELEGVVPGFREAILQMQKGGTYEVWIPSDKAYGSNPQPGSPIPADADLNFEVTLHEFMSQEEMLQRSMEINAVMDEVMAAQGEGEAAE